MLTAERRKRNFLSSFQVLQPDSIGAFRVEATEEKPSDVPSASVAHGHMLTCDREDAAGFKLNKRLR